MVAVALACLPVFFSGGVISRREGGFFLLCYGAYVLDLIAGSSGRETGTFLHFATMCIVGPLVLVTAIAMETAYGPW